MKASKVSKKEQPSAYDSYTEEQKDMVRKWLIGCGKLSESAPEAELKSVVDRLAKRNLDVLQSISVTGKRKRVERKMYIDPDAFRVQLADMYREPVKFIKLTMNAYVQCMSMLDITPDDYAFIMSHPDWGRPLYKHKIGYVEPEPEPEPEEDEVPEEEKEGGHAEAGQDGHAEEDDEEEDDDDYDDDEDDEDEYAGYIIVRKQVSDVETFLDALNNLANGVNVPDRLVERAIAACETKKDFGRVMKALKDSAFGKDFHAIWPLLSDNKNNIGTEVKEKIATFFKASNSSEALDAKSSSELEFSFTERMKRAYDFFSEMLTDRPKSKKAKKDDGDDGDDDDDDTETETETEPDNDDSEFEVNSDDEEEEETDDEEADDTSEDDGEVEEPEEEDDDDDDEEYENKDDESDDEDDDDAEDAESDEEE